MEKSSFFDAEYIGNDELGNPLYDRGFYANDFAEFIGSFIGNGVYPNPSTCLQVNSIDNNMTITLNKGNAWINGRFYQNTDGLKLVVENADGVLNRIDRVVLRLDYLKREIKAYIKKGTFASNPTAPILKRDTDCYELGIADIRINKGAIKVNQADITDLRLNNSMCGIVHGVISQVDTTSIFNQFQAWFTEHKTLHEGDFTTWFNRFVASADTWIAEFKNNKDIWFNDFKLLSRVEFDNWVNSLKNALDPNSDIVARLQVQITDNKNVIDVMKGTGIPKEKANKDDLTTHKNTNASVIQSGHVQLTSVMSESETESATPKMVNDLNANLLSCIEDELNPTNSDFSSIRLKTYKYPNGQIILLLKATFPGIPSKKSYNIGNILNYAIPKDFVQFDVLSFSSVDVPLKQAYGSINLYGQITVNSYSDGFDPATRKISGIISYHSTVGGVINV